MKLCLIIQHKVRSGDTARQMKIVFFSILTHDFFTSFHIFYSSSVFFFSNKCILRFVIVASLLSNLFFLLKISYIVVLVSFAFDKCLSYLQNRTAYKVYCKNKLQCAKNESQFLKHFPKF